MKGFASIKKRDIIYPVENHDIDCFEKAFESRTFVTFLDILINTAYNLH